MSSTDQEIFDAIERGDKEFVIDLIEEKKFCIHTQLVDIKRQKCGVNCNHGFTLLEIAIFHKQLDIASYLLDQGSNVTGHINKCNNLISCFGAVCLPIYCVIHDDQPMLELLGKHSTPIDFKNNHYQKFLLSTAVSNSFKMTQTLLKYFSGFQINFEETGNNNTSFYPPLFEAVKNDDSRTISLLLEAKADVNTKWAGVSVLTLRGLSIPSIEILLDAKADINYINKYGKTQLDLVALQNNFETYEYLTFIDAKSAGISAESLIQLIKTGNEEACVNAINAGAIISSTNNETPLFYATKYGMKNVIKLILCKLRNIEQSD